LGKKCHFSRYLPCKISGPFWAGAALGRVLELSQNNIKNNRYAYYDKPFDKENDKKIKIKNGIHI